MSALTLSCNINRNLDDSRKELKSAIESNTYKSFLLSFVSTLIILLLASLIPKSIIENIKGNGFGRTELGGKVNVDPGIAPPAVYISPAVTEKIMTEFVAGKPVAIEDADLLKSIKEFASWKDMSKSLSSTEGKIVDMKDIPNLEREIGTVEIKVKPEILPDINDVAFVEVNPGFDIEQLRKSIIYPKIAQDAGVTGKVVVRVLIDKNGKAIRTAIFYSESEMLEKAAVQAVTKLTYTPAIQNGIPVPCWLNIPINFVKKEK